MQIKPGNLDDPRVIKLLNTHVTTARGQTAPGSAHAIDHDGLRSPNVSLWTVWVGEDLVSVGALRRLSPDHSEIKSMHTAELARRTGAGSALLRHLIEIAKADGVTRLSLETGSWPYFAPARSFYARHGFVECPPFGDYVRDPNSVFMSLELRNS
jgi:putative acetyltransferase